MADLNGKWRFTIISMMGEMYSQYTFRTDDTALSGEAFDESTNETTPFEGGTYENNRFHFNITVKLPFGIMPFEIDGEYKEDDTLVGTSSMPMGISNFTAVRME